MTEFLNNISANLVSNVIWIALLFAAGLLTYFFKRGFQAARLFKHLKQNGIISFFPNRDSYTKDRPQSLEKYLETADHSLLYVGHWLAVSTDQRDTLAALRNILLGKKTVTIVMLSDELTPELLTAYANFFGRPVQDIQNQIQAGWTIVGSWSHTLGAEERNKLVLKSHSEFIGHSAFAFDLGQKKSKILIDQKLWGLDRKNSYGIELIANPKVDVIENTLFSRYANSIAKLHQHAALKHI